MDRPTHIEKISIILASFFGLFVFVGVFLDASKLISVPKSVFTSQSDILVSLLPQYLILITAILISLSLLLAILNLLVSGKLFSLFFLFGVFLATLFTGIVIYFELTELNTTLNELINSEGRGKFTLLISGIIGTYFSLSHRYGN